MRLEESKSLLNSAGVEGSLLISYSREKSRSFEVIGPTEHLHAFNVPGAKNTASTSSKRERRNSDIGAIKRRKRNINLPNQLKLYLKKPAKEQV